MSNQNSILLLIALSLAVSACGGGGGSSSSPPAAAKVPNSAPTFESDTSFELFEGTVDVGTVEVTDDNSTDSLSLEISGGSDESFFELGACNTSRCASNSLVFISKPDFENASDSDGDNRYELTLSAFDGTATTTQDISIFVLDAFEGRVVDAPISGASVFVDLNGNYELDDEEPSGITDEEGFFAVATFSLPDTVGAKVISKGGTDTKTGYSLPNLALISDVPADITKPANLTPLTTVIALVETEEEKAKVLTAMGIEQSPEELLTADNWEAAESGDEAAKATQRVNQQVGLLLQTASTVVDDGDEATDVSVAVAESVAETISEAAVSDEGVDLTSSETITTVLTEAVEEVAPEVEVEAEAITAVAESVATVNAVVADPALDPVSDVASDIIQSAQEDLQTSVAEVVKGEASLEEFESKTDTTELFSDVVVAVDALDTDGDGLADALDADDDGDGVNDVQDAFPKDATEALDTDSDGIGNNADTDDDGDGVADGSDAFPLDAAETLDTDSDGIGNNTDTDDDGDSVLDTADAFPLDASETIDTDSDGIGNNADTDDDGDGVADGSDAFPLDAAETLDTDSDGIGNNTDTDDDGDSVLDTADAFPLDATETIDTDSDGIGNNADTDDDGDGVADGSDAFPLDAAESLDTDSDGIGNNTDTDDDGDSVLDTADAFPLDATETIDTDSDGIGNNTDTDDDGDSVLDTVDAFPLDSGETLDTDSDGVGNNADTDDDGDGVADDRDSSPLDASVTPPTAVINLSTVSGRAPLLLDFDAASAIAGNSLNQVSQYSWTFSDGGTGSGEDGQYIFKTSGEWTISLTVRNDLGLTHTSTKSVSVQSFEGPISITGTVTVSANLHADSDVNDTYSEPVSNNTFDTAQSLPTPATVTGYVNLPGTGPDYDGAGRSRVSGDEFDYFVIDAYGGEQLSLLIADASGADLDLWLYDSSKTLIDGSAAVAGNSTESLTLPNTAGTYFVEVEAYSSGSNYNLVIESGASISRANKASLSKMEIIPGDIVVSFKPGAKGFSKQLSFINALDAESMRYGPVARNPRLLKFGDRAISLLRDLSTRKKFLNSSVGRRLSEIEERAATVLLAKRIMQDKNVEYAEPNFLRRASSIMPNDTLYDLQWHYSQINLTRAWDLTTGSPDVIVAVLDTGVAASHPDLESRLTQDGYDFIRDSAVSGDGDGIDADPSDPGDGKDNPSCPSETAGDRSSWHGTHVAGTIGAVTNNSIGVAGITWSTQIMDIRVLGCLGGTSYDIAQGVRYAAGLANDSGAVPARRANIINQSLGGPYEAIVELDANKAARAAGVIVVAASGNDAENGNPLGYPASSEGVISVAATNSAKERATYSQFNQYVDISAPGGDYTDRNGDGYDDLVVSTVAALDSDTTTFYSSYSGYQGTSMAAPHVAGVFALMESLYDFSPVEIDQVIKSGAITTDLGSPGRDEEFGLGEVDAYRAVLVAQSTASGNPIPSNPIFSATPSLVDFGSQLFTMSFTLSNAGTGDLIVSLINIDDEALKVTSPAVTSGLGLYNVTLDRTGLEDGLYQAKISFETNSSSTPVGTVYVRYRVGSAAAVKSQGAGVLWFGLENTDTGDSSWLHVTESGTSTAFTLPNIDPGVYRLIAGSDPDNDGYIGGLTEVFGRYRSEDEPTLLVGNGDFEGIDFNLSLQVPILQLSSAKTNDLVGDQSRANSKCWLSLPSRLKDEGGEQEKRCKASAVKASVVKKAQR